MDTEQNVNIITPEDVEFKVPKAGMKMGAKMEIHKHTIITVLDVKSEGKKDEAAINLRRQ